MAVGAPASQSDTAILRNRIVRLWIAFFRGQLMLMLIIGVSTWLGLSALGVAHAPGLGIIAGLLEIVPGVGPVVAAAAAAAIALAKGSSRLQISPQLLTGLVVLFYVVLQLLENYLILPRVMGDALDLPALVVLAGVIVGTLAGGVVGGILATPVIATVREILRYYRRKSSAQEPFPEED